MCFLAQCLQLNLWTPLLSPIRRRFYQHRRTVPWVWQYQHRWPWCHNLIQVYEWNRVILSMRFFHYYCCQLHRMLFIVILTIGRDRQFVWLQLCRLVLRRWLVQWWQRWQVVGQHLFRWWQLMRELPEHFLPLRLMLLYLFIQQELEMLAPLLLFLELQEMKLLIQLL